MQSFDSEQYKKGQQQAWSTLAPSWQRWNDSFERGAAVVAKRILALAAVRPGDSVLDLGTGTGEPALSFAAEVGPAGRVVGVDQAQPMLDLAAQQARAQGLTNLELVCADAEALAIEGTFDALVSRFGIMFLPAVRDVLRGLVAERLRPGGRFVASTWCEPARVPMIALSFDVVARVLGLPPPPPGMPSPFCLSVPDDLRGLAQAAGLEQVSIEEIEVPFRLADADEFVRYSTDLFPPFIRAQLAKADEATQRRIHEEIAAAARARIDGNGEVAMTSHALIVAGTKPAV